MKQSDFLKQLNLSLNVNTVYGSGAFGASIGNFPSQLERYAKNTLKRCGKEEEQKLRKAASNPPCWAFDCCGLVKGIIWGWNAVEDSVYGGAVYESNGLDDIGAGKDGLIAKCYDVTDDFSNIIPGELLWLDGHVGVYIGDGMEIECTTAWDDKVQKVECWNVKKTGRGRSWDKHGKMPWIEYDIKKSYSVVIGEFTTEVEAVEIQNALKALGTESTIVVK